MIPVKHIDPDDLPLYAMQLLPPEEMEAMGGDLQHSVEGRRALAEVYGDLSLFAHTADMQIVPGLARQRLMKNVAREKKAIPMSLVPARGYAEQTGPELVEDAPVKKSVAGKVLPWVGWALAAGMALPVVNFYQQRQQQGQELQQLRDTLAVNRSQLQKTEVSAALANTLMETVKDPSAVHVVLTGSEVKPPPQGRASYIAEKGSLVFLASNLDPLKAYQTYELWLIPADGGNAIPAGTFRPDARGNASVVMPQLPKGVAAKAFGVTVEAGEGSATPTAPILLKGAVS